MNDRAIQWIERLPSRWARNTAIFAAIVTLAPFALYLSDSRHSASTPGIMFGVIVALLLATGLLFVVAVFLIGMAARRHLRALRTLPDESVSDAVAWLPFQYFVWGLYLGYPVLLSDFVFQWRGFEPWDSTVPIASNAAQLLGTVLPMAVTTTLVGFISRAALRKRLGSHRGTLKSERRRTAFQLGDGY